MHIAHERFGQNKFEKPIRIWRIPIGPFGSVRYMLRMNRILTAEVVVIGYQMGFRYSTNLHRKACDSVFSSLALPFISYCRFFYANSSIVVIIVWMYFSAFIWLCSSPISINIPFWCAFSPFLFKMKKAKEKNHQQEPQEQTFLCTNLVRRSFHYEQIYVEIAYAALGFVFYHKCVLKQS